MASILTKKDVSFDEIRIFRQLQPDQITYKWYVNIGYQLTTIEGDTIDRNKQIELSTAQITQATNFFNNISAKIKIDEGI